MPLYLKSFSLLENNPKVCKERTTTLIRSCRYSGKVYILVHYCTATLKYKIFQIISYDMLSEFSLLKIFIRFVPMPCHPK